MNTQNSTIFEAFKARMEQELQQIRAGGNENILPNGVDIQIEPPPGLDLSKISIADFWMDRLRLDRVYDGASPLTAYPEPAPPDQAAPPGQMAAVQTPALSGAGVRAYKINCPGCGAPINPVQTKQTCEFCGTLVLIPASILGSAQPAAGMQKGSGAPVQLAQKLEWRVAPYDADGWVSLSPEVDIHFVKVHGGAFLMGSSESDPLASDDEKPGQWMDLPDYWITKHPITKAQYAAFRKASGYKGGESGFPAEQSNHPARVTWYEAREFAIWLEKNTGMLARLPNEPEWEKAARGSSGNIYAWGNAWEPGTRCPIEEPEFSLPVGLHRQGRSQFGCENVCNFIHEWTMGEYRDYPYQPDDGREEIYDVPRDDSSDFIIMAVRGSSSEYDNPSFARCARRWDSYAPSNSNGFRVVIFPEQAAQPRGAVGRAMHQGGQGANILVPLTNDVSMVFIPIPEGEFWMGNTESDTPLHKVNLPEYWIGKFPVTNEQFQAFIQQTKYRSKVRSGLNIRKDYPVVEATWQDAVAFCRWAGKATGKAIRLPSEAEWEKAARGDDARPYPWGESEPEGSHIFEPERPVGSKSPGKDSPYGVADMASMILEWTNSLYRDRPFVGGDGREDPLAEGERVQRGESCTKTTWHAEPNEATSELGFRVVMLPNAPTTQQQTQTSVKRCASCQNELTPNARFCNKCGAQVAQPQQAAVMPVPAVRTCPACGQEVSHRARFCNRCGQPIQD